MFCIGAIAEETGLTDSDGGDGVVVVVVAVEDVAGASTIMMSSGAG